MIVRLDYSSDWVLRIGGNRCRVEKMDVIHSPEPGGWYSEEPVCVCTTGGRVTTSGVNNDNSIIMTEELKECQLCHKSFPKSSKTMNFKEVLIFIISSYIY